MPRVSAKRDRDDRDHKRSDDQRPWGSAPWSAPLRGHPTFLLSACSIRNAWARYPFTLAQSLDPGASWSLEAGRRVRASDVDGAFKGVRPRCS
jgi:hypothetical protein